MCTCACGGQRSVFGVFPQILSVLFLNTACLMDLQSRLAPRKLQEFFSVYLPSIELTSTCGMTDFLMWVLDIEGGANTFLANLCHQFPGLRTLFLWLQSPSHISVLYHHILSTLTYGNLYAIIIKYFHIIIM